MCARMSCLVMNLSRLVCMDSTTLASSTETLHAENIPCLNCLLHFLSTVLKAMPILIICCQLVKIGSIIASFRLETASLSREHLRFFHSKAAFQSLKRRFSRLSERFCKVSITYICTQWGLHSLRDAIAFIEQVQLEISYDDLAGVQMALLRCFVIKVAKLHRTSDWAEQNKIEMSWTYTEGSNSWSIEFGLGALAYCISVKHHVHTADQF